MRERGMFHHLPVKSLLMGLLVGLCPWLVTSPMFFLRRFLPALSDTGRLEGAQVRGMPSPHGFGTRLRYSLLSAEKAFVTAKALGIFHKDYSFLPLARAMKIF